METQSVTPAAKDKGVWAVVLNAAAVMLAAWLTTKLGFEVDAAKLAVILGSIVAPVIQFIWSHKNKSKEIILAEIEARAKAVVAKETPPLPTTPEKAADAINAIK